MGLKKKKEVIISEKPSAAKKIAEAIGGKNLKREKEGQITYYKIELPEKDIYVVPAVGHLFGLAEKSKSNFSYPVFEIEWKPLFEVDKKTAHTKKYLQLLKKVLKDADEVIVACDYDVEGELIGYNIVRFLFDVNKAKRMKFSTLTPRELRESYEKALPTIDFGQAIAGETRHILDWYYGINLSRSLMHSLRTNNMYRILSMGRVQGPALKIVVDREREIENFKPTPYWEITLIAKKDKDKIEFSWEKGKIEDKDLFEKIKEKVTGAKFIKIKEVKKKREEVKAPFPFDLTTLQTQAYRWFKIKPNETLQIAQNLYLGGYISYPRTSSQQIDPTKINIKEILQGLNKLNEYTSYVSNLLNKKELKPSNGKKSDPAHPAIHPTGIIPKKLNEREKKIYDLIVRRFLASLEEKAVREVTTLVGEVNDVKFIAKGIIYIKEGWREIYKRYVDSKENVLPPIKEGESLEIEKINFEEKETKPPARYTPASLVKELERRNLGTKATRANIIQTLYERGYIVNDPIVPTTLGKSVVETMEKFFPSIINEDLTRKFEEDMERIKENTVLQKKVLENAKTIITSTLEKIKKLEREVGKSLSEAHKKTLDEERIIGTCPKCGQDIVIRESKNGKFLGCKGWPNCTFTVSLRNSRSVKKSNKKCEKCGWHYLEFRVGKRKRVVCMNPFCETNKEKEERAAILRKENKEKRCPKCNSPLVVREYLGEFFLGCSRWPECDYIENIKK